ncbi:MAG TPA: hypothetical protein VMR21_04975 [Vicinamibacteria bacterium]|nr:hypothetical protein [Vicinamibacteria bacterium]
MKARGRPPLTEEAVRLRISDYCARWGVSTVNEVGLPAFPAGQRETRQHREWLVLYKAVRRLQDRQEAAGSTERQAALQRQNGRCPVCLQEVSPRDRLARHTAAAEVLVHAQCDAMLRGAAQVGPEGLDRVRACLWPARPPTRRP